jgi:hypothetical protein
MDVAIPVRRVRTSKRQKKKMGERKKEGKEVKGVMRDSGLFFRKYQLSK